MGAAWALLVTLSLFERLVHAGVEPCLLDTQYRMHPAISQFPSDCFYAGKIADGITAAHRPDPKGLDWPRWVTWGCAVPAYVAYGLNV